MDAYIARLLRYNNWANLTLLRFLETVPPSVLDVRISGVYGNIRQTLDHSLTSEVRYWRYLMGLPRLATDHPAMPELGYLRALAEACTANMIALGNVPPEADSFLQLPDGNRRAATVMVQILMHGSEHRTQVATILGTQGIAEPDIDAWAFGILEDGDDWPAGWAPRLTAG